MGLGVIEILSQIAAQLDFFVGFVVVFFFFFPIDKMSFGYFCFALSANWPETEVFRNNSKKKKNNKNGGRVVVACI